MRLALTGATSGVGRRLAEVALDAGHAVRGLVREPSRPDAHGLQERGVSLVPGDLSDDAALGELCDGADAVIHTAAHVGDWGDAEDFVRVNVVGTDKVLEAAARADVRRFVQLSSTAVYGRPERGRVTEEWPTRIRGVPYDDTKTESERLVFRRGPELGIEVAAVRPPIIYGPYDRNFMPRTLAMLRQRRLPLIDGGRAPLNVVWVDHVVDVLLACCSSPDAAGQAFNVMDTVNERPPSVREVTETIAHAAGLPPPRLSVPYPVAYALAHAVEGVFRLARVRRHPPISPFVVKIATLDVIYDASKAVERLGWKPRMKPLDGLARYARELSSYRQRTSDSGQ